MKNLRFFQNSNHHLNNRVMIYTLSLLTFLFPFFLNAQSLLQDWTKRYGSSHTAIFNDVIESTNAKVVAVGEIEQSGQGKDGFVVITDFETGEVLVEKQLGGKKDDVLNAVAQTREGQFILVGYTESKGSGKRDAWAVLINEKGNIIREKTYGTTGNDAFWDVVPKGGDIVVAGLKEDRKDGDIWICSINTQNLKEDKEKMVGAGKLEIFRAMDILKDGTIVMAGNTGKLHRGDKLKGGIWIQRVRWDDRRGWIPFSPDFISNQEAEEAFDIVANADGSYAIAATKEVDGKGKEIWVMMLNAFHTEQWSKTFGDTNRDIPLAIAPRAEGGFLIVGQSDFKHIGTKMKLLALDTDGQTIDELHLDLNKNDQGTSLCLLHNGAHIIAGANDRKAALIKIKTPNTGKTLSDLDGIGRMDITAMDFQLNTLNNTLKKGDITYMSFLVSNNSEMDIQDVQVKVKPNALTQGVQFWDENYIGTLKAKEQKLVSIPVYGASNLQEGTSRLNVELHSQGVYLNDFSTEIQSESDNSPMGVLSFNKDMVEVGDNNKGTLVLNVRNDKRTTVRNLEVAVKYPNGIVNNGLPTQTISSLDAGANKKLMFHFIVTPDQRGNDLSINCTLTEDGKLTGNQSVPVRLGGGGSGNAPFTAVISTSVVTFVQPFTTGAETRVDAEGDKFQFTLKAITPGVVKPNDFKVYVNQSELDNSKFGETELSPPEKVSDKFYHRYFSAAVPLQIGENKIEVRLAGEGANQGISETLIVNYNPGKPNLHLLAIGPTHGDLKYTSNDAAAFAKAFKTQEGLLFERVIVHELVTKAKTTNIEIQKALTDLKTRYQNSNSENTINKRDVVLVFISSHGTKDNKNSFKLLPSDYDPSYADILAIDYKEKVLNILNEIDCKKLVLIDACQSGSASKSAGLSESLVKLNNAASGLTTITSCQANELSYEDDKWQHGAFTKAILEAFENKTFYDEEGAFKASLDSEITVKELYNFLRRRVPHLVKTDKGDTPTTQIPHLPLNQLSDDMPIFFVN